MVNILQVIREFAAFDPVYLLTRSGPANSILTLSLYMYRQAFQFKRLGYASALAIALFLVPTCFTVIYLRLVKGGGVGGG